MSSGQWSGRDWDSFNWTWGKIDAYDGRSSAQGDGTASAWNSSRGEGDRTDARDASRAFMTSQSNLDFRSWVCYYKCTFCSRTWRSPSSSAMVERKLCSNCRTSVIPFDRILRWSRSCEASARTSSDGWHNYVFVEFDPAFMQYGFEHVSALSQYDYEHECEEHYQLTHSALKCNTKDLKEAAFSAFKIPFIIRRNMNARIAEHIHRALQDKLEKPMTHNASSLAARMSDPSMLKRRKLRFTTSYSVDYECGSVQRVCLVISTEPLPKTRGQSRGQSTRSQAKGLSLKEAQTLARQVDWGSLIAIGGEHAVECCEKCKFYCRPCRLHVAPCVDETFLRLDDIGEETSEDALKCVFPDAVDNVKEVLIGLADDIAAYVNANPEQRKTMADEVRARSAELHYSHVKDQLQNVEGKLARLKLTESCMIEATRASYEQLKRHKEDLENKCRQASHMHTAFSAKVDLHAHASQFIKALPKHAVRAAIVRFGSAERARQAIDCFGRIRAEQAQFEQRYLQVGLMNKRWTTWPSILFLQEVQLVRDSQGPVRSVLNHVIRRHCFGQICKLGANRFKLVMISLPHWLRKAVEEIHKLSAILGSFHVYDTGSLCQVIRPEQVLQMGYVADVGSEHRVRLPSADFGSSNGGGAWSSCVPALSPIDDARSGSSVATKSDGVPFDLPDCDTPSNGNFVQVVEQVCGISDIEALRLFLHTFYAQAEHDPLLNPLLSTSPPCAQIAASSFAGSGDAKDEASAYDLASGLSLTSSASFLSQGKCFLFDTMVLCSNGRLVKAQELYKNAEVQSSQGQLLRVTSFTVHPLQERELVEIHAGGAWLVVTDTHRVMVIKGSSESSEETAPASSIRPGDSVKCDTGVQKVSDIRKYKESVQVVEIGLWPDFPIATHMLPSSAILSKGVRAGRSRAGRREQRRGRAARTNAMPNTDSDLAYPR